ncbi:MAG: hypothetical protein PHT48_12845 [Dechloromonas sp.]|nr:hypothetical protein [Dechloromonas sp.]
MSVIQFLISALRAMLEVFMLSLLGQIALYLLLGSGRQQNVIYRLFSLLTAGPRRFVARCLPAATSPRPIASLTLLLAFAVWLLLAWLRKL